MKKIKKILTLGAIPFIVIGVAFFVLMIALMGQVINEDSETGLDDGIELSEIGENEIPAQYIPIYKAAGREYDMAWTVIAAIHKVETNFSTSPTMESSAGAIGHFQFLPETWLGWSYGTNPPKQAYTNPTLISRHGGYGVDADGDGKADPYNLKDSAFSCANYLKASGGMDNLDKAIYAYNHADWYVKKVMGYYKQYTKGDYTTAGNSTGGKGKGQFKLPIDHPITVTSPYADRIHPITGARDYHNGIDLVNMKVNAPIYASLSGVVMNASYLKSYGNCVVIKHNNGFYTTYAHLKSFNVRVGQQVKTGQQIAVMGTTGDSTGVHLHFCIGRSMLGDFTNPASYIGL